MMVLEQQAKWINKHRIAVFLLIVLLVFFSIFHLNILIVLIMSAISAAVVFVESKYNLPFDFTPTFFFTIVATHYFGWHYSIPIIILGSVLPAIASGGFDPNSLFFWTLMFILNLISALFSGMGLLQLGIIMSTIELIAGGGLSMLLGTPKGVAIGQSIFAFFANLIYFVYFGGLITRFIA